MCEYAIYNEQQNNNNNNNNKKQVNDVNAVYREVYKTE